MRVRQVMGALAVLAVMLFMAAPAGADTYTGPAGRTPQVVGATAQAVRVPTPAVAPVAAGGSGSGLPVTGTDVVGLLVVGIGALGLGVVLVRRAGVRRSRLA